MQRALRVGTSDARSAIRPVATLARNAILVVEAQRKGDPDFRGYFSLRCSIYHRPLRWLRRLPSFSDGFIDAHFVGKCGASANSPAYHLGCCATDVVRMFLGFIPSPISR